MKMYLCSKCGFMMCGENCTNRECDEHYNSDFRILKEALKETENAKKEEPRD
jgi:hypothetical protein